MSDQARKQTDEELKKLEREIYELYATSQVEISEKWRAYMSSHEKKLNRLYEELEAAKKSGDSEAIKDAKDEYERAVKNVTLNDKRYRAMINETTAKLAHVNEIALDHVNDKMPKIYTLNYNEFGNEDINGYTFTLVNEQAVKNLISNDKINLPPKKLDVPKDKLWNAKNINSQLLQGILQGENISKITKRLQTVTDMNRSSAIRNARTMVTEAENKGRQDSFVKASSDGVIMDREWIAAHDDHTRAWHLDLHGVRVAIDEPWENDYGKIMYPGDPSADPCNIYNCRCSIRAHVRGFKWNNTEEYKPNVDNVVDFDGKEKVIDALENMDPDEAKEWNNYINDVNYKIITEEESETAFFMSGTKDINLFDYSSEGTFFHETAHALDDNAITGTVEIRGSRKAIGSDDWIETKPYIYEVNGASRAAEEIYNMNEHAWSEDNAAFMRWAKMENEDDLKSLIRSVREFEKEHGEAAAGVLGDMIDAHTLGKYPMSVFSGGHGESYWKRDASLASKEAWAEISSLKAQGNQAAIDALADILPNRVRSEETIYDIVFKGGADYEHKITDETDTRVSEQIWRFRKKS